jgi:hypothetical protein
MLLVDAVHTIETVGGIWLGMSAITFILLGVFIEIRRKSRDGLASKRSPQLDLVVKTDKKTLSKPLSKKATSREAA